MKTLTIYRQNINVPALDAALRSGLGSQYGGLSTYPDAVLVYLGDETPFAQEQQAEQIVIDHDPSILTAGQQAELDQQQALAQFRANNPTALNLSAYDGTAAEVQTLAAKIAWLEREIRDLRGL